MWRGNLLHRMKEVCGAISRLMKDKLIVGRTEPSFEFIYNIYTKMYTFFDIIGSQVRCYNILYLLSLIVTMY